MSLCDKMVGNYIENNSHCLIYDYILKKDISHSLLESSYQMNRNMLK